MAFRKLPCGRLAAYNKTFLCAQNSNGERIWTILKVSPGTLFQRLDNEMAAISPHFMFYNFVRIHQTLRITPAMAAGVTDRVCEIADIVKLVDAKPDYEDAQYGSALGIDPMGHGGKYRA